MYSKYSPPHAPRQLPPSHGRSFIPTSPYDDPSTPHNSSPNLPPSRGQSFIPNAYDDSSTLHNPSPNLPPSHGRSFSPSPYDDPSPLHNSSPSPRTGSMNSTRDSAPYGYATRGSPPPEDWSAEPPSPKFARGAPSPMPHFTLADASAMLPSMFDRNGPLPGPRASSRMGTLNNVYAEGNNTYNPWRGGDALFGDTEDTRDDDYSHENEWVKSRNKLKEKVFSSIPDAVTAHVFNDMPINVVRARDMKLISREELKRDIIKEITDDLEGESDEDWGEVAEFMQQIKDTESAVQTLLKESVKTATQYAILSHRWGADELTYATLKDANPHALSWMVNSEGYVKVSEFIQAAQAYECPYVWFDTGCIDKSSSSEVEESIRSMFTWYRRAEVCLVYLADSSVSILGDEWFTRGWTLQELLAPSRIKFFGAEWVPLTRLKYDIDRVSEEVVEHGSPKFIQDLMKASGILNMDRLTNFSPGITYAREVLHWASQRRTTRPEDMVYCLFGLLGLQLPVAYGEGFQSAFFRLQVELVQRSEDRGLFFWSGFPSPGNSMLAANLAGFRESAPWSDEGVRVDRLYTSCLDKDPTISMTNCGIRMVIPKYPVDLVSVTSSYQSAAGRVYELRLGIPHLQCYANVSIQLTYDPDRDDIAKTWSIGLLGTALITRQRYSTFLPILLRRTSNTSSQRYSRLFTDRFLLDIEINDELRLKDPEVIYVK